MDTVSMLNKMSFYCQPILPLVYDESMSYYETLCKVVGQLNTTGETVNKLNEGLTGEIADRQAADAELDKRLKLIEEADKRIHFLVFVGANPNSSMPTRTELWNWVRDGDIICAIYSANDTERGDVYAASCTYNAGNWSTENSSDFHFLIPLETTYDSTGKLAVKQKIVKLTIPSYTNHVLTVPWGEEIIEINTPHTSAEGIVNFSATVDNNNTVHSNLSPAEFTSLYRTVSKGSGGLIVGINAQLTTNDSQLLLSTSADIIGGETAADDEVRIVFDAETYIGERGLDLPYLTRPIYILAGSGTDETWTLTKFQTRDFAFDRDEGFQFTRAANNVITPSFGSTPKEVAEYFGTVKGGVPYQNLPVRLVDTVDNAEYWNGTFHSYSDGHMTFTFVTSNYTTESNEMLVKIIELSATKAGSEWADSDTWKYGVQEFRVPIKDVVTYTASNVGEGVYSATKHKIEYQVDFNETTANIIAAIESGKKVILRVDLKELGSNETYPVYFASGYTRADPFTNSAHYIFAGTLGGDQFTLELNSLLTHATLVTYGYILPEPNPDGSDNGKVPTVESNKWELKTPTGGKSAYQYAVEGGYTGTEEEFAEKMAQKTDIPSALPNPNALTITSGSDSVTYDGSAAKSIDIPSLENIVTETTQVPPAYTNLIPTSTDASGAILNGVGYEAGTLGANGAVTEGTAFISGFIPVKKGDVVRIKDPHAANFSTDNVIALYKADKATSANIRKYVSGMQSNAAYGSITISGDVMTWDTSSVTYYPWNDFKYMRVMTLSADSIVTINEEIKESTQTVMTLKPTVKVSKGNLNFAVNEPMLAGRKIVVFGDSLIGMTRDSTSVPAYAAAYTGATVYNVGFGGCRMAKHPTNGYAAFSMWALADAVSTGDYSTQEAQAPSGSYYFASQLAVLKSIDFETVDAIVIHYGTNDFTANVPIDDSANLLSTDTVCGALRYSIKKILTAFPKIKIFVSLPLYRTWDGVGAETYKNTLEKTLPEYDSAMKTVAENHNLPTIDGYKQLGINSINSSAYLSDGTHLNDFGRKQFGEFIGGCLICGA